MRAQKILFFILFKEKSHICDTHKYARANVGQQGGWVHITFCIEALNMIQYKEKY